MKKLIITTAIGAIVLIIILFPFLLPNSITGYIEKVGPLMNSPWNEWAIASTILMGMCTGWSIMELVEKLYHYIRKD